MRAPASTKPGLEILRNYPNPFDASTCMVLRSETNPQHEETYLTVRKGDGTLLERRKITIQQGMNEYRFDYGNDGGIGVV